MKKTIPLQSLVHFNNTVRWDTVRNILNNTNRSYNKFWRCVRALSWIKNNYVTQFDRHCICYTVLHVILQPSRSQQTNSIVKTCQMTRGFAWKGVDCSSLFTTLEAHRALAERISNKWDVTKIRQIATTKWYTPDCQPICHRLVRIIPLRQITPVYKWPRNDKPKQVNKIRPRFC